MCAYLWCTIKVNSEHDIKFRVRLFTKHDKKKLKINLRNGHLRNFKQCYILCNNGCMSIVDDKSKLSMTLSSGLEYSQKHNKKNLR
jgi:hypothetical protein